MNRFIYVNILPTCNLRTSWKKLFGFAQRILNCLTWQKQPYLGSMSTKTIRGKVSEATYEFSISPSLSPWNSKDQGLERFSPSQTPHIRPPISDPPFQAPNLRPPISGPQSQTPHLRPLISDLPSQAPHFRPPISDPHLRPPSQAHCKFHYYYYRARLQYQAPKPHTFRARLRYQAPTMLDSTRTLVFREYNIRHQQCQTPHFSSETTISNPDNVRLHAFRLRLQYQAPTMSDPTRFLRDYNIRPQQCHTPCFSCEITISGPNNVIPHTFRSRIQYQAPTMSDPTLFRSRQQYQAPTMSDPTLVFDRANYKMSKRTKGRSALADKITIVRV